MTDQKAVKVIRAMGFANGRHCPHVGQWLLSFDFNAHNGQGFGVFTKNPAKAMRFDDAKAAFAFWRTQSVVKPLRPDGKPNRPLTALTIEIENVP